MRSLRERIEAHDPAVVEFFDAAERSGYRAAWGNSQNLTLYHDGMLLDGWNADARHWYLAVRWLSEARLRRFAECHHFVFRTRGRTREVYTLTGANNLHHFRAVVEELTRVRIRP